MENFILEITPKMTVKKLQNLEQIGYKDEFDSIEDCLNSVRGMANFLYFNREVEAFITINRHDVENGNLPCTKYSINLETLELTEL